MITNSSSQGPAAFPLILCHAFLLIVFLFPLGSSTHAQNTLVQNEERQTPTCIKVERTQSELSKEVGAQGRELLPCGEHEYQIQLAANQYIRVAVYLHGIDITLTAFAPDGTELEQVVSPGIIEGKKASGG